MIRVLFVCLGNICRSPMAEAVFTHLVQEARLDEKIEVDSAGTGDWHIGQPAHHGTRQILAKNGILYEGCARLIEKSDLENFDYIITMDDSNFRNVGQLGKGRAKIASLMSFAPHAGAAEVPDPYYSGGFDKVYQLVNAGAEGLLKTIRQEHGL